MKQRILIEHPLEKSVEELILLDVHRSFQTVKEIKPEALINILNAYAYLDEDVKYCQGMNFVTGFLYLLLREESETLKFLKCLIERYSMQQLYTIDVPLVKQYFFELDRLLFMTYPDLSSYLRAEGISTSFFTSAWFMTLFSYSMQHKTEEGSLDMMLAIWDAFLVDGWKAIFKVSLFIFGELKEKILDAKFDQIMTIFRELPRGEMLHNASTATRLMEQYGKIKITNTKLRDLSEEYATTFENAFQDSSSEQGPPPRNKT